MDTPLSGVSGLCRRRRVGRSVAAGAILPHTAHGHRLRKTLPRRAQSSSAACDRLGRRSLSPAHRVPIRAAFCIGSAGPALYSPVGGRLTDGLYKAPLSRGRSA